MNYFHLYKQAAPKNIINKYKIQDPILKLLITKYEKDIDQKQIDEYVKQGNTGEQAFDEYIINVLLQNIYNNVDRNNQESPYYLNKEQTEQEIKEEINRNLGNPQLQQAAQIYRNNPEQAINQVMKSINDSKEQVLKGWIEYLPTNDLYVENPAFCYLILKSIFKETEKSKDTPISVNAEVLPKIYDFMKTGKDFSIYKTYKKLNDEQRIQSLSMQKTEGENGWIKIPSRQNDPQNFEANVRKLTDLSTGNGWCTATGNALPYLSEGDFWMYIENGRAAVAVRFVGNSVREIQGRNNQRPFAYWNVIEKLFDDNNFDKNSRHYQELLEVKRNNEKMESDPNFRQQFIELCKNDFKNLHKIDEKYIDDDMIEQLLPVVKNRFINNPKLMLELPSKMQKNQEIRLLCKSAFIRILPAYPGGYVSAKEIFPNDRDIYEASKQGYLKRVKTEPAVHYEKAIELFPNDKDEFYEIGKQGYLQIVKKDIRWYEQAIELFPNDKEEFYEIAIQGYPKLVEDSPYLYEKAIKLFPNDKELFYAKAKEYYLGFLKEYPRKYESVVKLFPEDKEEFYELAKQGYLRSVKKDPRYYQEALELFPNYKEEFYEVAKQGYLKLFKNNPTFYYEEAIELFPNDKEELYEAYKQHYLELVKNNPKFYYEEAIKLFPNDKELFYEAGKQIVLESVKKDPRYYQEAIRLFPNDKEMFYDAAKEGYLQLVKSHPEYLYKDAIRLFPNDKEEFNEAFKQGWLQLVKREPKKYYEKALKLFSNDKDEFYEIGKQGYLQLIQEDPYYYEKAIELFPNDKEKFYELGKQRWFDLVETDADEFYRRAIKLFPNDKEFFANALHKYRVNKLHRYPLQDSEMDDSLFINPVYNNARKQGFLDVFAGKTLVETQEMFECIKKSRKLYPNDAEIYTASKESVLRLLEPPNYNFADPVILHAFPNDDDIFEKFFKLWESYMTLMPYLDKGKAEYIKAFARDLHRFPISRQSDVWSRFQEILEKLTNQKPKQSCGWYTKVKYSHF